MLSNIRLVCLAEPNRYCLVVNKASKNNAIFFFYYANILEHNQNNRIFINYKIAGIKVKVIDRLDSRLDKNGKLDI